MGLLTRFRRAWNTFKNYDRTDIVSSHSYGRNPDRPFIGYTAERSIVASLYNRIAMDVASLKVNHVRVDENGRFLDYKQSGLNYCLSVEANKDQTSRQFLHDVVLSMFTEGSVAIVPIDLDIDPTNSDAYDVLSMRVGKVLEWYPDHVRVDVYNDQSGEHEQLIMPKRLVAIVENPFYSVMNESNSMIKRLMNKLSQLDSIDEQSSSGKLDIIIQFPFAIKNEMAKERADNRLKSIENQLKGSRYGIAYIDATERVTQLNRPAENNLMEQIEYLTEMVYSQLGITKEIFYGTADERMSLNYMNSTIEPIISAITDAIDVKFISMTARTQGQRIMYFKDTFDLVPVNDIANAADKFSSNEILTSNEIRSLIGFKPFDDPRADELRNKHLNATNDQLTDKPETNQNGSEKEVNDDDKRRPETREN